MVELLHIALFNSSIYHCSCDRLSVVCRTLIWMDLHFRIGDNLLETIYKWINIQYFHFICMFTICLPNRNHRKITFMESLRSQFITNHSFSPQTKVEQDKNVLFERRLSQCTYVAFIAKEFSGEWKEINSWSFKWNRFIKQFIKSQHIWRIANNPTNPCCYSVVLVLNRFEVRIPCKSSEGSIKLENINQNIWKSCHSYDEQVFSLFNFPENSFNR